MHIKTLLMHMLFLINGLCLALTDYQSGTGHAGNFARVAVPGTTRGAVVVVTPCAVVEGLLQ